MKPEDIDKLFKERLGGSTPTPPADLWNRLQDRIETEMPAAGKSETRPRGFMWLSYSIAAAITLLLSVGVVFYSLQKGTAPADREDLATLNGQQPEQPLVLPEPATSGEQIAQATEPAVPVIAEEVRTEPAIPAENSSKHSGIATAPAASKAKPKSGVRKPDQKNSAKSPAASPQFLAQKEQSAIPDTPQRVELDNTGETTPVMFASNTVDLNAQPVEIIIKRTVAVEEVETDEEVSGFEKKQKLAKNIFKQVRNLSNGERVELSELGINADRIALETQIGKQKISKVINL